MRNYANSNGLAGSLHRLYESSRDKVASSPSQVLVNNFFDILANRGYSHENRVRKASSLLKEYSNLLSQDTKQVVSEALEIYSSHLRSNSIKSKKGIGRVMKKSAVKEYLPIAKELHALKREYSPVIVLELDQNINSERKNRRSFSGLLRKISQAAVIGLSSLGISSNSYAPMMKYEHPVEVHQTPVTSNDKMKSALESLLVNIRERLSNYAEYELKNKKLYPQEKIVPIEEVLAQIEISLVKTTQTPTLDTNPEKDAAIYLGNKVHLILGSNLQRANQIDEENKTYDFPRLERETDFYNKIKGIAERKGLGTSHLSAPTLKKKSNPHSKEVDGLIKKASLNPSQESEYRRTLASLNQILDNNSSDEYIWISRPNN